VPIEKLTSGSRLLEECFGPVAIVTEYGDRAELESALDALQGTLAAAVMAAGDEDPDVPWLVERLTKLAGRVTVDDWPTGVAVTWAQQHGGPWPATTVPSTTSVGAAALTRFTRPVAYQNIPDKALPPALRASNPWQLPRRTNGKPTTPKPPASPAFSPRESRFRAHKASRVSLSAPRESRVRPL
jgi:NADP-dependent aldehyde dehydrogenase